jgi:hypothetical protein
VRQGLAPAVRLFFAKNSQYPALEQSFNATESGDHTMLDDTLKSQLAAYLERVTLPFELVATLGDDDTSRQMRELLQTIQSLRADKITLRTDGT